MRKYETKETEIYNKIIKNSDKMEEFKDKKLITLDHLNLKQLKKIEKILEGIK